MSPLIRQSERKRVTRKSVILADRVARLVITLGGIATIAAISAVAVFLLLVALPLFTPPRVQAMHDHPMPEGIGAPLFVMLNEEKCLGAVLGQDGVLKSFDARDGAPIKEIALPKEPALVSFSPPSADGTTLLGFADGTIRLARLQFRDSFLSEAKADMARGESKRVDEGILTRLPDHQYRLTEVEFRWEDPVATGLTAPVVFLDHVPTQQGTVIATGDEGGNLFLHQLRVRKNLLTGKSATQLTSVRVEIPPEGRPAGPWKEVALFGEASGLLIVPETGPLLRFNTRNLQAPQFVGSESDRSEGNADAITWMRGRNTILIGRSSGSLRGAFLARPDGNNDSSRQELLWAKDLRPIGSEPAVALTTSVRTSLAAVVDEASELSLYQVTRDAEVISVKLPFPTKDAQVAIAPRDDAVLVVTPERFARVDLQLGYPEVSFATLFLPVWYEGYSRPTHVWQTDTSGGAEPKLGLVPLIFGTIKATIFSMLFGAPIALLAAIYTSEFLSPKVKSRLKPTIEMMASLPSVVLGFMGAAVLAPWVSRHLAETLMSLILVPIVFLLFGHLWQLVPSKWALRLERGRFALCVLTLPLGVVAALILAPPIESIFFGGDVRSWLGSHNGFRVGGWMYLLFPLAGFAVAWFFGRWNGRWGAAPTTRYQAAKQALILFLFGLLLAFLLALVISLVFSAVGWDVRGMVVGPYNNQNSLIVGFVMGFAIIPLIYTIAEDALATVPEHLRSASLGAGATPWQTAMRIVVPTATSGLFSAIMVGLGRAVGETMIVLMVTGSTAIMEWNIFSGFRTLSANIAIELAEATVNTAHYRTLFLSAVVLFVLTSALNTVAELVRMRFRRRAYQL